ncbi:MAG: VOC family protein, partial [Gaiellales bacterium]
HPVLDVGRYVGVAVDDPQAALDRAESLGGRTVMPVTEIPDMVTLALFADPQGHVIGIVKSQ